MILDCVIVSALRHFIETIYCNPAFVWKCKFCEKCIKIDAQLGTSACWFWFGKKAPNQTPRIFLRFVDYFLGLCLHQINNVCGRSSISSLCVRLLCIHSKPLKFSIKYQPLNVAFVQNAMCISQSVSNTIRIHNNYFHAYRFNWPNFPFYSLFENSNSVVCVYLR